MTQKIKHKMKLEQPIHFIGIGGTGMNPLAFLLKEMGFDVQGSDISSTKVLQKLDAQGISVFPEHLADNVKNAKSVVYSTAIPDDNPELLQAKENGSTILHRSELLDIIARDKKAIFVAGSHGKTSTSGLIAHILQHAGYSPSAIIGGSMLNYSSYHLCGKGDYFVAEADESDGSFLKYFPFVSVITNIDNDHLDHYGSFENLKTAFKKFGSSTDEEGLKVYGWDSEPLRDVARDTGDFIGYGSLIGCHNRIIKIEQKQSHTKFKCVIEHDIHEFEIKQIGTHSVHNALAAITVAIDLGIEIDLIKEALLCFKGMGRRLELVHEDKQFTLINDYAHNPGKITSAIEAVSKAYPTSKIITVFQPHRYSRLETMYELFSKAFEQSDQVIVTPIFAAGEKSVENINHVKLARDISHLSSVDAIPIHHLNEIYDTLDVKHSAHSVILLVGAGDIGMACDPLVERMICSENS
ncbi:UDP-N-acetylmuramate--L-alanine ligase [bacterium]|nr:UDP-N-acetylmuramate--L-alanine ligase [bacterium]